ncbi:MAG: hypothetical protein Q9218_003843 [Villophora microphyllina]
MHTPTGNGSHSEPEPLNSQALSPPPPPSPSADIQNLQQATSPTQDNQDPEAIFQDTDIDIFALSPTAALKMLCSLANALIEFAKIVPPAPSVTSRSPPEPRIVVSGKENQPTQSGSSGSDRRRFQHPPPKELVDAESIPERAKTPIGSPEIKAAEPSDTADTSSPSVSSSSAWPLSSSSSSSSSWSCSPDSQHTVLGRRFNSKRLPPIPLIDYLTRLLKYCELSTGACLATGLYIFRLAVVERLITLTPHNIHRLLLAGLRVAGKANDDKNYPHKRWAMVGGIPETELTKLEIAFCYLTDFDLRVTPEILTNHVRLARTIIGNMERSPG